MCCADNILKGLVQYVGIRIVKNQLLNGIVWDHVLKGAAIKGENILSFKSSPYENRK